MTAWATYRSSQQLIYASLWDGAVKRGLRAVDSFQQMEHNVEMPLAYEYVTLDWVCQTNWSDIRDIPEPVRPQVTWESRFELWRAGATEGEKLDPGATVTDILNNLGESGWRLVDHLVLDTCVTGPLHGVMEGGTPLRRQWIFMRERSS